MWKGLVNVQSVMVQTVWSLCRLHCVPAQVFSLVLTMVQTNEAAFFVSPTVWIPSTCQLPIMQGQYGTLIHLSLKIPNFWGLLIQWRKPTEWFKIMWQGFESFFLKLLGKVANSRLCSSSSILMQPINETTVKITIFLQYAIGKTFYYIAHL